MQIEYSKSAVKAIHSMLAWDSDFSKLTPTERQRLEQAEQEIEAGETVSHDEIDWN